jgi:hypothetical protein
MEQETDSRENEVRYFVAQKEKQARKYYDKRKRDYDKPLRPYKDRPRMKNIRYYEDEEE